MSTRPAPGRATGPGRISGRHRADPRPPRGARADLLPPPQIRAPRCRGSTKEARPRLPSGRGACKPAQPSAEPPIPEPSGAPPATNDRCERPAGAETTRCCPRGNNAAPAEPLRTRQTPRATPNEPNASCRSIGPSTALPTMGNTDPTASDPGVALRLAASDDVVVAYQARTRALGMAESDPTATSLRAAIAASPRARALLSHRAAGRHDPAQPLRQVPGTALDAGLPRPDRLPAGRP